LELYLIDYWINHSLLEEGNSVGVSVEVGWVSSHEDISEDEVVEALWEVHSLDSHDALAGNLQSVVVGSQHVIGGVDGEGEVWEGAEVGAVLGDFDTLDEFVGDVLWSGEEGSSGVNDGQ